MIHLSPRGATLSNPFTRATIEDCALVEATGDFSGEGAYGKTVFRDGGLALHADGAAVPSKSSRITVTRNDSSAVALRVSCSGGGIQQTMELTLGRMARQFHLELSAHRLRPTDTAHRLRPPSACVVPLHAATDRPSARRRARRIARR